MSRPYFIHIPQDLLYTDYSQEIIRKNNIDIYKGNTVYPKRMDRFMLDFDYYVQKNGLTGNDLDKEHYHKIFNSNYVHSVFMKKFMENKYNATMQYQCGGGRRGYTYFVYIDDDYNYVYFYTLNLFKHKKAKQDFGGQKAFFINVYRIPYKVFDIFLYQDKYEARFIQYARGFEFTCDTEQKWNRLRKGNKKISR